MILRLFCVALFAYAAALPSLAEEGPPTDLDKRASTLFQASYQDTCDSDEDLRDAPFKQMEKFELNYVPTEDTETGSKKAIVYRFVCSFGSYYLEHVYFWWRDDVSLQPLLFAKPTFAAKFEIGDDPSSKLVSIDVTGFTSKAEMINSEVDVLAGTIIEDSKWGGLGDVGSHGVWFLDDGNFRLDQFDIDPSRDGKQNLVTVLRYPKQ
jgi:hypothetical protein